MPEPDPPEIRSRVGRAIRQLRLHKKWTQDQLADRVKSSGKYIGRIERGKANIGIDTLDRIAGALAVDAADLISAPGSDRAIKGMVLVPESELDHVIKRLTRAKSRRAPRSRR